MGRMTCFCIPQASGRPVALDMDVRHPETFTHNSVRAATPQWSCCLRPVATQLSPDFIPAWLPPSSFMTMPMIFKTSGGSMKSWRFVLSFFFVCLWFCHFLKCLPFDYQASYILGASPPAFDKIIVSMSTNELIKKWQKTDCPHVKTASLTQLWILPYFFVK